ncbi:hypothetical protein BOTNAR_0297g00050 [Botryotinia narcissicola]|uniref:Uncharacterized protein n=1 Tax=Botryotinia narcissicola TaxID=278944 RepID=A0A4Z1I1U3_9HELO|nr:hypothetical protein BOTNAR_0297g00050 [Botryotinia narcissicola]
MDPRQSRNVPKYGAWSESPQISGLTPLALLFPKANMDPEEIVLRNRIEDFQREQFDGFTARELADMDVITDRQLKESTLDNPIMPLFQQQRWEMQPHQPDLTRDHMYPLIIDGAQRGDWSMHNPLVYEKMKPVLQLASRTIMSMYTLPWFAALIFGERVSIDPARIRLKDEVPDNLVAFLPYHITDYSLVRKRMEQVFDDLEKNWNCKYGFMSTDEDPRGPEYPIDPEDELPDSVYGLTVTNYQYMEYHEAENKEWQIYRKMVEWATAITLVHEIIHAINFVCPRIDGTRVQNQDDENPPWFFDEEPLAEAGFSFEVALNGGTVRSFTTAVKGMPYGHWFETVWPSVESQDLCGPVTPEIGHDNRILRERWKSVHAILGAQGETEEGKIALRFGMSLLNSSKIESSFWTHEEPQRRGVAAIFEHLSKQSVSEEERLSDFTHLIGFMWTIVQNHKNKIDALLKPDQADIPQIQVPSEERRRVLLAWNRGTSIFVNQCLKEFSNASEDHRFQLSTLRLSLEILRLQLFSPDLRAETIKFGPDFIELALLLHLQDSFLKGDRVSCRDYVKSIREIEGCSLFAFLCTLWIDTIIYEGSETGLERVKGMREFEAMGKWWRELWERSSQGEWKEMFRIWEEVREDAERTLRSAHHIARSAFYQLPGHVNIQAAPLPPYPLYYLGHPVPQFATLTQTNAWINHSILHPSFGPPPLPDDHPAVPYPAEPGKQWLGYIAPSSGRYIPMNNPAHYINPYDINGARGFPPNTLPAHLVHPPPILPPQITYQRPASHLAPALRPHHPPPRNSRFAPPSTVGYLAGGLPGLQNSLLNTSHGLNGPPIANPMADLAVIGYRDENNLVAMENQRILRQIDIPDGPEMMNEFCEETRGEVERLRPVWEMERGGGASLSNFGPMSANTGGSGGEWGAGEVRDSGDEEDSLRESDMDYEG